MTEESELLRQYAEAGSETAFAELVRRRIDLVFSVALRQVGGDAALAEDVTQKVFADLARKSRALCRHPVLGGWLYRATQFAAGDAVRAEQRRRNREQEAAKMNEILATPGHGDEWEKLRPALDRTISELSPADRDVLVLRFFESRTFGDIGRILSLREDAARMRVDRALGRLRGRLEKLGATSSATALATALASQVGAAPAQLAAKVAFAATSGAALVGSTSLGLGIFALMNTTKLILGAVAALGLGAALFEARNLRLQQQSLDAALQQRDDLQARLSRSERSRQAAEADNAKLLEATSRLQASTAAAAQLPPTRPTHADIEARFRHAQEMAKSGDAKGALKEFLWLFDEGMRGETSYGGVRLSYLLDAIFKLGAQDPDALAALRARRDQALAQATGASEPGATMDLAAINRVLGEESKTLAFYDQMSPDDPGRRILGNSIYEQLVTTQRYTDALQTRPYKIMNMTFKAAVQAETMVASANPATVQAHHNYILNSTANNIEVLAGAGDLAHAQALTANLLGYDGSDAARAILQTHLAKAGHPELLNGPAPAQ